jgi:HK97 gp10 family phage protein
MKLEGGKKLLAAFDKLPEAVGKKLLVPVIRKAAKPMVKEAKAGAPKRTGLLRIAIGVKAYRPRGSKTTSLAVIGVRTKFKTKKNTKLAGSGKGSKIEIQPAKYAHLVEFGTAQHWVRANRSGVLSFAGIVTKAALVGASRDQPFMTPAFNKKSGTALRLIKANLWRGIRKEARRLSA